MLKHLEIQNYKSLHDVSLDLNPFSVLVGANAAGKSNFADAIDFLSQVARYGLPQAISNKGGYENICFKRHRRAKGAIRFRLKTGVFEASSTGHPEQLLDFDYEFAFRATRRAIRSDYVVEAESLRATSRDDKGKSCSVLSYSRTPSGTEVVTSGEEGSSLLFPTKKLIDSMLQKLQPEKVQSDLFVTSLFRGVPPFLLLLQYLSSLEVFQVMPSNAREPSAASGSAEMGRYGDNLPAALNALHERAEDNYEKLMEYLSLVVPSIERVGLDYVETSRLGLFVKERGINRRMYSNELSDGTVRAIGILLPLVDPRSAVVVIEEPENSVHPWATRQFVSACRDCSNPRQVILTTHSPTLVSGLELHELFVVTRRNSETVIVPAGDMGEDVEEVIRESIMDLGAYWDSGAMGGVPEQLPLFDD